MIQITNSNNVWIDHNDLSSDINHGVDYYGYAISILHGSDWITISWNKFYAHHRVSTGTLLSGNALPTNILTVVYLVGHSDSNSSEDLGKLHVSYHHNYFDGGM